MVFNDKDALRDYIEGIKYLEKFYKIFRKVGAGEREVYLIPFWQFYERVCNLTIAKDYKEAFYYREKMSAQNIIDYLENASLNLIEKEKKEKIKSLLKRYGEKYKELKEDEEEFSEVNKELDKIEEELIKIWDEIALEISYFNISQDINISQIQKSLKPEEIIVEYYYEGKEPNKSKEEDEKIEIDRLHIWIIDKEKIGYKKIDLEEPFTIKEKDWQEVLGLDNWKEITKKFYENLIKPIEQDISKKAVIYIVPYRALWNLPFNWFWDGKRFLGERFVISYLPSSSLLFLIRNRNKENVKKEEFLAIMKENYEKERLVSFKGAEEHFQKVIKKFNGKEDNIINIDKKATKKTELLEGIKKLKDESLKSSKVYLAICLHGVIDEKARNSYFVLNGNEKLYCEELMEIGNWGIDTTFLISCWSGKKINLGDYGDIFTNFVASLMAIGCKRVMAPIIKIDFQSAIEYLKDFFDLLLGKKYLFIKIRKPLKKVLVELFKREIKKYRKQPVKKWPLFVFFGPLP